jgi:hypothetical protein
MTTAAETSRTAVVVRDREYDGLTMAVAPAEAKRRLQELKAFVKEVMVKDVDYGRIPGTPKDSLYQPGAQKLAEIYGFAASFEPVEVIKDWEHGFFAFDVRCLLTSRRDGRPVGEGIGHCNSREARYAWRWIKEVDLPPGTDKSKILKAQRDDWVFDNKVPAGLDRSKLPKEERVSNRTGGKYTVFNVGTVAYRVPNPDIADLVNTLQKMACKRAYVMAVISVTRSSDIFTQDVEDLPPEVFGKPAETRSWQESDVAEEPEATASEEKPATKAAKAKPVVEQTPPTEAQTKLYEESKVTVEASDSLAALARVAKTLGQYVREKKLAPPHVADLHQVAGAVQKRLRAAQAQEPADREPPPDERTAGEEERQPGED